MNSTIVLPPVSIEIKPPALHESSPIYLLPKEGGVYDLEFLRAEAQRLNITPTRPNIRRIRRAYDIVENDKVRQIGQFGHVRIYEVNSQTRDRVHLVVVNKVTGCTCEDARRRPDLTGCKHSIAVRIYEEQRADQARYDEWLCEQYEQEQAACLSPAHYEDPVDFSY